MKELGDNYLHLLSILAIPLSHMHTLVNGSIFSQVKEDESIYKVNSWKH